MSKSEQIAAAYRELAELEEAVALKLAEIAEGPCGEKNSAWKKMAETRAARVLSYQQRAEYFDGRGLGGKEIRSKIAGLSPEKRAALLETLEALAAE